VARIAPTTTGAQAARASACTLGDELRVRDVSEDRVNSSPTSVPTAEAGEYRARRSAAKTPKHRQGQRDQEPQRCRAIGEHDLSESRTCLQSQHGSCQTSTNGAEETSQPARFHASAGGTLGKVTYRTLGAVAHLEQDAVLPTAASADPRRSSVMMERDSSAGFAVCVRSWRLVVALVLTGCATTPQGAGTAHPL
jgi:hypothetical protein